MTSTTNRCSLDVSSYAIIMVVRGSIPKGLISFSKCPMTDRGALDGPSCTTVMVAIDHIPNGLKIFSMFPTTDLYDGRSCINPILQGLKIFSKCQMTNLYDEPSCFRRYVLHNHHDCQRLSFWESPIKFHKYFMKERHHVPSCSRWIVNWSVIQHRNYINTIVIFVLRFYFLISMFFVSTCTKCCSFQVLTLRVPKLDCMYARGHSTSVALSTRLVIGIDNERTLNTFPQALPLLHMLHVPPEPTPRRWRPM